MTDPAVLASDGETPDPDSPNGLVLDVMNTSDWKVPTLSALADDYMKSALASGQFVPSTAIRVKYRLRALVDSFGMRPLPQLTSGAIDRFMVTVAHTSAATRRLYLSAVRGFCRWLVRRRLIKRDPTEHIKIRQPRSVPRAFSPEQVAALLRVLPDARAHVIVRLMLDMGLRCVEVARLRVEDYDPTSKVLLVVGKGGHQRELPVVASTVRALDNYFAEVGVVGGPLVRSYNMPERGVGAQYISNLVVGWIADAGLKARKFDGRSAHALRHTAGSDVLEHSGDVKAVQEMLGHASLVTTEIYLRHAGLARLRDAMSGRDYRPVSA